MVKFSEKENKKLYLSNRLINKEALKRGIKVEILNAGKNLVILTHKSKTAFMQATKTFLNSSVSLVITDHKDLANIVFERFGFPVPRRENATNSREAAAIASKIGFPVVLKRPTGTGGKYVYPGISNIKELKRFAKELLKDEKKVIIEKQVIGSDYRFLVVDSRCVSVVERTPAFVVGDGVKNIAELVKEENKNPLRKPLHLGPLLNIEIDGETRRILKNSGMTIDSIPKRNQKVQLKYTANHSKGGSTEIVTDKVHPDNKKLAEDIAKKFNLGIAGVDFMTSDASLSYKKNNLYVIEVNATPSFGLHYQPSFGKGEDVSPYVLDLLFPETKK